MLFLYNTNSMLHSKFYQLQILHHLDNDLFGNYFVILNHLYNCLFGNCFVIFTPQEGMSSRFQIIPFVERQFLENKGSVLDPGRLSNTSVKFYK